MSFSWNSLGKWIFRVFDCEDFYIIAKVGNIDWRGLSSCVAGTSTILGLSIGGAFISDLRKNYVQYLSIAALSVAGGYVLSGILNFAAHSESSFYSAIFLMI
jgi:hypothetical protein